MNPEDSIEIDGHTFYVSASFDGTAVTQMTLDVAGQEVDVYPEKKEFTDGDDVALMSLLPLEKRNLSVDLSGFSPIELSRVRLCGNPLIRITMALYRKQTHGNWIFHISFTERVEYR